MKCNKRPQSYNTQGSSIWKSTDESPAMCRSCGHWALRVGIITLDNFDLRIENISLKHHEHVLIMIRRNTRMTRFQLASHRVARSFFRTWLATWSWKDNFRALFHDWPTIAAGGFNMEMRKKNSLNHTLGYYQGPKTKETKPGGRGVKNSTNKKKTKRKKKKAQTTKNIP